MNVILMGPPGSGKGTQAAVLAWFQDLRHVSTGDMLRAAVASGSALGKRVEGIMAAGELVPDDVMMQIVKERLEELNEELETLNAEARELEERIAENVGKLLEV